MNILSNYPDIIKEALIPMIIAIFAFVFPLLFQIISKIDEKYNSPMLIKTFKKDWICEWFLWILVSAIASYVIWIFQLAAILFTISIIVLIIMMFCLAYIYYALERRNRLTTKKIDNINRSFFIALSFYFISYILCLCQKANDNSVVILVAVCTISLVVMTFLIAYLTYIYYLPEKLLKHLINKYDKTKDKKKKTLYLQAISKILNYSIQTIDEPLAEKLWEFYFSEIFKFRKNKENQEIVYSEEIYYTFLEANEILCEQNKRAISRFNNNTIVDLFLDEYQKTVISRDSYSFFWKLILQSLHYNRKDFVLSYWRKAHQLCSLFIQRIYPELDYKTFEFGGFKVKNQSEIEKRDKEIEDFLEFHYALGGLLMFKQKYGIIKEIMNYTQQQPPKYVLVPERMQQVIERYMQIDDERKYLNPVYYEQRYQFPDIYGVNADDTIRMWIKRYLAILFIRQYTLHEYYVNSNTLTTPQPPQDLSELNRWKEELDSLKYFINEYLSQKNILKELGFEKLYSPDSNANIYSDWFEKNNKIKPSDLIENFKNEIKNKQPIAHEKEDEFQEKTIKHLKPIFEKYSEVFINKQIGNNYRSYYIGGQHYILEREAFSNNQSMGYVGTNSVTAQAVAMNFQYYALNVFTLMFPEKYFLTEKEVFFAIDKLNINSDDFIIIAVGLNIEYFSSNIKGLEKDGEKWYYNKMEIVEIDYYMNDLVTQSLFILKKEDLPNMIFKKIDDEDVKKYSLKNNIFNIYTGLIDLNQNESLRREIKQANQEVDLSQKVLACVDINVEIQRKENAKCIQLKAFSQFDDRGKANKLEDVKSIWDNIK